MRSIPRLRDLNPLRLLNTGFAYQPLSSLSDSRNGSPWDPQKSRWPSPTRIAENWRRWGRMSTTKLMATLVACVVILALLGGGGYKHVKSRSRPEVEESPLPFYWQQYYRLDGYYNGVRTLVPFSQYEPENGYNQTVPARLSDADVVGLSPEPPLSPVLYNPYPDFGSSEYSDKHESFHQCYVDAAESIPAPDVYVYPGVPQHMAEPLFGSHKELGLRDDVCFERFGRFAPYGYGWNQSQGGLGTANRSEQAGSDKVLKQIGHVNYQGTNWGAAQTRCHEKNKARFDQHQSGGKQRVKRHAYILRTWTGYTYSENQILSLRAMINELSLKSGGEYDVHFLVHVKNNSIPIWADKGVYQRTLQENVPEEFWNISTLWSEQYMMLYYPEPFTDNFANMAGSNLHGVYRSAHFPLQWFSQQHPEYDFYWNWEMDIRYTGHYYELNDRIGAWAKKQPRKGLWERGKRFYIPKFHGDYQNFTKFVERETVEKDIAENDLERNGPVPIWGPVQDFPNTGMMSPPNSTLPPTTYEADDYTWGVDEDADLITFNPLFDPSMTNWVFSWDVTGYNRSLPVPPRRAAIITVARLSKRLLDTMHAEVWSQKHTMFPEMWPPTVCMHHGFKAVYVPHPVYFDRDWEVGYMDRVLNYPDEIWSSPFGWGEHNLLGSSFYYNSGFAGALWRRWMGQWENGEGGRQQEERGTGRMCLRSTLHHPVKHEAGPVD